MSDVLIDECEEITCQQCGGDGWYVAHDPKCPEGEPIQVQCEACYGEGKI